MTAEHVWVEVGSHLVCSVCFRKTSVEDYRGLMKTECTDSENCQECAELGFRYCCDRDTY